jgi:hypothetical protein
MIHMKTFLPFTVCLLVLGACSGSETSVYDKNGLLKGHVTVNSSEMATVVNKSGTIVGEVKGSEIFNRSGSKVGSVQSDGDIEDRNDTIVGTIKGERCIAKGGSEVGHLTSDIDNEAAAGACLLLLLLQ